MTYFVFLPMQFIAAADTQQIYILLGILVVFFVVLFIGARNSPSTTSNTKMSIGKFRKQAKNAGLSKSQTQILERGIKTQKIANPGKLFFHGGMLNKVLRTLIEDIQNTSHSESQKEAVISEIFSIKRVLADNSKIIAGPTSRLLQQGQEITFYTRHHPPFESRITGNMESRLAVERPKTPQGLPVNFRRGEACRVRVVRETGKVYRFDSKILELAHSEGIDVILVDHVKEMQEIQLRKHPRKDMNKPTYFQRIEIISEGKGKKMVKRAVVQKNRRFLGQIEDISVGGCAIFSRSPLKRGELLKISFDLGPGDTITAFGKVLHLRPNKPMGGIMHIGFTRVSRKNLNHIQSFVYGLTGPEVF